MSNDTPNFWKHEITALAVPEMSNFVAWWDSMTCGGVPIQHKIIFWRQITWCFWDNNHHYSRRQGRGFNSLIIIVAWEIWKHRNDCLQWQNQMSQWCCKQSLKSVSYGVLLEQKVSSRCLPGRFKQARAAGLWLMSAYNWNRLAAWFFSLNKLR